ncbi:MAG TPA: FecR domain-containing protein [bacterium]|nr:FecR domain-containing protein [bacterium]
MKSFKPVLAGIGITVFLCGGLGLAMHTITAPTVFPDTPLMLIPTAGESLIEAEGELVAQSIQTPVEIVEGATIQIPSGSTADLQMYDQGVIHLAAETIVVIETAAQDEAQPTKVNLELSLRDGSAWVNFASHEEEDRYIRLRTSAGYAESQGGVFILAVDSDKRSSVFVAEGAATFGGLVGEKNVRLTGEQFAAVEGGEVTQENMHEGDFALPYRNADQQFFSHFHDGQLEYFKQQRKLDPESSLYVFRRFTEQLWLRSARNVEKRTALLARFVIGRMVDAYIEELAHDDHLRAQILIDHAASMATPEVWEDPQVVRARQLFSWTDLETDK